jgi:hypothetical protein
MGDAWILDAVHEPLRRMDGDAVAPGRPARRDETGHPMKMGSGPGIGFDTLGERV